MAKFIIETSTAKGKTWKATGTNPLTGRSITIQGGQKGVKVGKNNPVVKGRLMPATMQLA